MKSPIVLPVDMCEKSAGWVANSADPEKPRSVAYDLGPHCLFKPVSVSECIVNMVLFSRASIDRPVRLGHEIA